MVDGLFHRLCVDTILCWVLSSATVQNTSQVWLEIYICAVVTQNTVIEVQKMYVALIILKDKITINL